MKAEGYSKDDPEAVRWFQERDKADAFLTKGQDIVKDAKSEVERLQALVDAKERESSQPSSYDSGYGGGGGGGDDVMRLEMELQIAKTRARRGIEHLPPRGPAFARTSPRRWRAKSATSSGYAESCRTRKSPRRLTSAAEAPRSSEEPAAVAAVEMRFRARQAEVAREQTPRRGRVATGGDQLDARRARGGAARARRALRRGAGRGEPRTRDRTARERPRGGGEARVVRVAGTRRENAQQSYDVDDRLRRELDEAKTRFDYATQEADRKRNDAARAAADRDNKIEALEFSLSRVDMPPMEARYAAEDTATGVVSVCARLKTD